uniref:Uncharacterized protein n=1 Tax=Manihot esculenta TaxID=3983 RepID=A0A2C9TZJ7_MANES
MNLENRAWGLKTLPHSGPGAFNWSFLSPLSPMSGEFPFSPLGSSRARGNGLSFPGPPRLCTRRLPRLLEDARAI